PSYEVMTIFKSAFQTTESKITVTGYARCDGLIKNQFKFPIEINKFSKKIIYVPTHRKYGEKSSALDNFINNCNDINQELIRLNYLLIYKPHNLDLKYITKMNLTFSNIIFVGNNIEESDIYSYLNQSDLLVTDYSS